MQTDQERIQRELVAIAKREGFESVFLLLVRDTPDGKIEVWNVGESTGSAIKEKHLFAAATKLSMKVINNIPCDENGRALLEPDRYEQAAMGVRDRRFDS